MGSVVRLLDLRHASAESRCVHRECGTRNCYFSVLWYHLAHYHMYVYHKKCVPKTFVDVLLYGNTLSKIPLCAAIDTMSEIWKSQTFAKIVALAVTLL